MKKSHLLLSFLLLLLISLAGASGCTPDQARAASDAALVAKLEGVVMPQVQTVLETEAQDRLGRFTAFSGTNFQRIHLLGSYQIHLSRTGNFQRAAIPIRIVVREGKGIRLHNAHLLSTVPDGPMPANLTNSVVQVNAEAPLRNKLFP